MTAEVHFTVAKEYEQQVQDILKEWQKKGSKSAKIVQAIIHLYNSETKNNKIDTYFKTTLETLPRADTLWRAADIAKLEYRDLEALHNITLHNLHIIKENVIFKNKLV